METLQAMKKRRSIRAYQAKPVPQEILKDILLAGCVGPVGMGQYQSLHFTLIQNPALLQRISKAVQQQIHAQKDPLYGVPALILISSKASKVPNIAYVNAGCMMENMLLAATDHGVGSVILWGVALAVEQDLQLQADLQLPAEFQPVLAAGFGYGAGAVPSEKEWKETVSINRV